MRSDGLALRLVSGGALGLGRAASKGWRSWWLWGVLWFGIRMGTRDASLGGAWDACGPLAGVFERAAGGASYEDGACPANFCLLSTPPLLTAVRIAAAEIARATMPSPRRIRRAVVVFAAASALSPGAKQLAQSRRPNFRRARGVEPGAAAAPFRPRRSVACRAGNDDDAPQPAFGAERRRRRPALSNLASVQRGVDEKPPLDDDRPPTGAVLESLVAGERELYESTHERIGAGLKDLTNWAGFMFRANAMGLTEQVDLSKSVKDRIRHAVSVAKGEACLLYTSPSPRDATLSRMPSSA